MTEQESKTQEIASQRNIVTIGFSGSFIGSSDGSVKAGLTVRDNHLRTVSIQLNIETIDKLIEELQLARTHLRIEAGIQGLKEGKIA